MAAPEVGQVVDGRYELEAVIGKGGMGSVFRARHVFTHQRVALKLITDTLDADSGTRFLAEARAASTIGHPAIVHVSDANRMSNGQLYLVMELLAGKPLRLAMQQPADQIRRIGLELLDALAAAHARGVIHRDLKPENIFLVAPTGAVKILDFGIAKVIGAGTTTHGHTLGTLEYMAPEQLYDSAQVTSSADLWAIGVILYELIAGVRPYGGATIEAKYRALAMDEPMPIEDVVQVTPEVAAFFRNALARDPAQRFQSAARMADALRALRFTGGAPAGTGAGWNATGNNANPTLGTGAQWAPPAGNPGPTLGTGWQQPASIPQPGNGAAYATPAPIQPSTGAAYPTPAPIQPLTGAAAPSAPAKRGLVIAGAIGVVVVGAAIAFGVVAGSRGTTTAPGDAAVVRDVDAAVTVPVPSAPDCKAQCERVAGCQLAMPSCVRDCEQDQIYRDCITRGKACSDFGNCYWNRFCGRPPKFGRTAKGTTCRTGMTCWSQNASQDSAMLCSTCFDPMSDDAATALARFMVCTTANQVATQRAVEAGKSPDPKWWTEHCQPLSEACTAH